MNWRNQLKKQTLKDGGECIRELFLFINQELLKYKLSLIYKLFFILGMLVVLLYLRNLDLISKTYLEVIVSILVMLLGTVGYAIMNVSGLISDVTYYNRIFTGRRHSTASINTYIDLLSTLVDKAKTSDEIVEEFIETHAINKPKHRRVVS